MDHCLHAKNGQRPSPADCGRAFDGRIVPTGACPAAPQSFQFIPTETPMSLPPTQQCGLDATRPPVESEASWQSVATARPPPPGSKWAAGPLAVIAQSVQTLRLLVNWCLSITVNREIQRNGVSRDRHSVFPDQCPGAARKTRSRVEHHGDHAGRTAHYRLPERRQSNRLHGRPTRAPKKFSFEPQRGPRPLEGYIGLRNHSNNDIVFFKEVAVRPLTK